MKGEFSVILQQLPNSLSLEHYISLDAISKMSAILQATDSTQVCIILIMKKHISVQIWISNKILISKKTSATIDLQNVFFMYEY